jgi:hypothetical protein
LILLDAETILKQVQHKVQHDIFICFPLYDTVSCKRDKREEKISPFGKACLPVGRGDEGGF